MRPQLFSFSWKVPPVCSWSLARGQGLTARNLPPTGNLAYLHLGRDARPLPGWGSPDFVGWFPTADQLAREESCPKMAILGDSVGGLWCLGKNIIALCQYWRQKYHTILSQNWSVIQLSQPQNSRKGVTHSRPKGDMHIPLPWAAQPKGCSCWTLSPKNWCQLMPNHILCQADSAIAMAKPLLRPMPPPLSIAIWATPPNPLGDVMPPARALAI